jgi:hypothetical protein
MAGGLDPVLGIHWLREAYEKAVPGYERGVTVPAIVDIPAGAVVTADFRLFAGPVRLDHPALPRGAGRTAVRRRDAAGPAATRGKGAGEARR